MAPLTLLLMVPETETVFARHRRCLRQAPPICFARSSLKVSIQSMAARSSVWPFKSAFLCATDRIWVDHCCCRKCSRLYFPHAMIRRIDQLLSPRFKGRAVAPRGLLSGLRRTSGIWRLQRMPAKVTALRPGSDRAAALQGAAPGLRQRKVELAKRLNPELSLMAPQIPPPVATSNSPL